MKYTKTCPKCQSTDIVRFDGDDGARDAVNRLQTSFFNFVNVNRYICCNCGFVEEWIDKKDIKEVAKSKKAIR